MSGLISVVQTGTDKPVVRLPDLKTMPKIGDGFSQKKEQVLKRKRLKSGEKVSVMVRSHQ